MSVGQLESAEIQLEKPSGLWRDAWHRLIRNPAALVGFALVGIFVLIAIFAPLLAPYSPRAQGNLIESLQGPSWHHLAGLDDLARDEFSRVIFGARYSLVIGLVAVVAGLSSGLLLGSAAGYLGGFVDSLIMRLMDIMLAIPGLLLAIGLVAALGQGLWQIMVAVGVKRRWILLSHILPNAISPVIVQGTLAMATAIIDVAGLGFLGLGPQDPGTPEWGTMLTGVDRYLQSAPYLAIFPGLAIVLSVLGFNLIGDGLREALDPKLRGRA